MSAFRFMHAADLHLDSPFRGLSGLPEAIRSEIRESTFRALENMVTLALDEAVDFVLIAGDVYDASDRSLRAQLRFQRELRRLSAAGIAVFIVHGNHDPESGSRAELAWPERVHFFSSLEASRIGVNSRGGKRVAEISGMSFAFVSVTDNLAQKLSPGDPSLYQIALLHANVDGDGDHDNYAPCSKRQLAQSGFDYWALGHIHMRRVLQEQPLIVYPGNIQGRSIKECGAKGCYIAEVSETGETRLDFHAIDAVRWFHEEIDVEAAASEQELKDELEARLEELREQAEGRSAVVRIVLAGRTPLYGKLAQPAFLQELTSELRSDQERFADDRQTPFLWIESLENRTGIPVDLSELAGQDSFIGDLLRLTERLLQDEHLLQAFGEQAMQPLLGNPKAVKYLQSASLDDLRRRLGDARELAVDSLAGETGWDD